MKSLCLKPWSGARVEKLSLKNISISGKDDIGSLAYEAQNNTKIQQVHVDGVLAGERGIGGLLAKAEQSASQRAVSREELSTLVKRLLPTISVVWLVI